MTLLSVFKLFAAYVIIIARARAYPTTVTLPTVNNATQLDAFQFAVNESHIFDIPPGIFTTFVPLPGEASINDDKDDYVPYRSDVHDSFSWALIKQILVSTTPRRNVIATAAAAGADNLPEDAENIVFSPFSVKLVLALLTEATGNGTRSQQQLLATLGDIRSLENLRNFYRKTLTTLKKEHADYTLRLETRLYTDNSVQALPSYATLLKSAYQTPVDNLDFNDGVAAAEKINTWIARVTEGRLKQLVTDESVAKSVMLLVNAIYFNGKWRRQFTETHTGAFYRSATDQVKVAYMELTDHFYYHESNELKAKIVRLPYRGQKFSMFIALPNEGQNIDSFISRMQNEQLKHMQWMTERSKVRVVLPKFKFAYKTDLKAALCRLGVIDIFTNNANLTAMAANEDLQLMVSNILQKSGIDVNEVGTVAYGATEVEIVNRFGADEEEFIVNRPFAFFIEEESTGNILFAGKVMNPTT
ncbi:serine protease inhibitor 27A-like [Bactrocera neohumeralis]|uniref:serine protease inhibitor 27A-like n=1 Tax=Bactrocera neohumeralis TaxID=98809 RepID=UPI002165145B|nr:serine protease inhibitor 27A-like [Bactrocera neohumeralis]